MIKIVIYVKLMGFKLRHFIKQVPVTIMPELSEPEPHRVTSPAPPKGCGSGFTTQLTHS
jgi:hypothetical protein